MSGHVLTIVATDTPADWPHQKSWTYYRTAGPSASDAFDEFVSLLSTAGEDFDVDETALSITWRRAIDGQRWTEVQTFQPDPPTDSRPDPSDAGP